MQLAKEIEEILSNSPLTPSEITEELNRKRSKKTSTIEVIETTRKNQETLQEINGKIVSISNFKWKETIRAYWYVLNTLQNNYNNSDLQFIIAALFFYKRTIDLNKNSNLHHQVHSYKFPDHNPRSHDELQTWLRELPNLDQQFQNTLNTFYDLSNLLQKLPPERLENTVHMIHQVDTLSFSAIEFSTIFDYILEARAPSTYKNQAIGTPPQISELMAKLLKPEGGTVYDPVCGTGSLLAHVARVSNDNIRIKGNEILHSLAQIALMNLNMHDLYSLEINQRNCFDETHDSHRYDYIIGDLPLLGLTANNSRWSEKGFIPLLDFVVSKLHNRGKAVLTISDSFLLSMGRNQAYREHLLQEDIVECIISLPTGSLKPFTNGKSSIVILNKAKPSYLINKVKFITAENLTPASQLPIIDTLSILNLYQDKSSESRNSQIVSIEKVLAQKSLSASSYTDDLQEAEKLLKDGKARKLGELVEIVSGASSRDTQDLAPDVPYIKIENLEKDILDMHLSSGKISSQTSKTKLTTKSLIKEKAILIARIGDNLKPTIFKPSKTLPEIITHAGVITLRPLTKPPLDIEYLYYQLYSPLVQKQIEQRRIGTVMPFINKRLLSDIIIPMMPLDSQREFISTQKSNIIAAEKEKVNQRLRAIGFEEESIQKENELISTLVHELRPKLVKINSLSNKLIRIIEKHNISTLTQYDQHDIEADENIHELVEPLENFDIGFVSQKIASDSKELNDTLSLVKEVMNLNLKPSEFTETKLLDFLKSYLYTKKSEPPNKYKIEVKGVETEAVIHRASIQQVIDQLINNAESHAFPTPSAKDKIVFTVKEDKERKIAIIEYTNNGMPFTLKKSDYTQFFTKSKSSNGSGIGGNYIYRIIKAHNGDIEIEQNKTKGFSMKIEIPNKEEQ